MPRDILKLAQDNAVNLRKRWTEFPREPHHETFVTRVNREAIVSINLSHERLTKEVKAGRLRNVYDEAADNYPAAIEQWIIQRQNQSGQDWGSKRIVFDDEFDGGRKFIYGAACLPDTLGLTGFAGRCYIHLTGYQQSVFLPGNSLTRYISKDVAGAAYAVSMSRLCHDIGADPEKGIVAAIKHCHDERMRDEGKCGEMLCTPHQKDDWTEAIIPGPVPIPTENLNVRVPQITRWTDSFIDHVERTPEPYLETKREAYAVRREMEEFLDQDTQDLVQLLDKHQVRYTFYKDV